MFQPLWRFSVPLTSGLSSILAVPDSVWASVFFPPMFPLPWPCWILHNLQLRGCFCVLAFPDPTPFWSTALRHVLLIPVYLSLSPMRLWAPRRQMRACVFFIVFPTMPGTSFNRLALCPQAKSTSGSLLCATICFNCTVEHDRANDRWVPVIKQSGDFKHFHSFLEQSLSLGNK